MSQGLGFKSCLVLLSDKPLEAEIFFMMGAAGGRESHIFNDGLKGSTVDI